MKTSTYDSVKKSKVPILYICGDKDTFVPLKFTKKNYELTNNEKELYTERIDIRHTLYEYYIMQRFPQRGTYDQA